MVSEQKSGSCRNTVKGQLTDRVQCSCGPDPDSSGPQRTLPLERLDTLGDVSIYLSDVVRRALILEIQNLLSRMRTTGREAANMWKRPRRVLNVWRCEEEVGGSWSSKLYRNLLGIGKTQSCKQHHCSTMQERLMLHQMSCHGKAKLDKALTARPHRAKISRIDRYSTTSTKSSVGTITSRLNSSLKRKHESNSAQTNLIFAENLDTTHGKHNKGDKEHNRTHSYDRHDVLKNTETHAILPKRNVYSERLNNEIHKFFYDIPVFPNTSETVKQKRIEIINNFTNKIVDLLSCINDEDYYDKVTNEIKECLRDLPMWQPESERDKSVFKNSLAVSLLKFIKTFNDQWFNIRIDKFSTKFPQSFMAYNEYVNHVLENEIIDWVKSNLKFSDRNDATDTLIKKVKSILESGIVEKDALKSEIITILEELSPHLHLPGNKILRINELATNLANVLSVMVNKNDVGDKQSCKIRDINNEDLIEIVDDSKLRDDDTVNLLTDTLFSSLDLVLHENSHDVVKDIHSILKSTGELSESEAASLAKTLVTNVKECFNENFYTKMANLNRSSSFLILTSEQELSHSDGPAFHSTPSTNVRKKEIPKLNKTEKLFIEKVSAVVRSWLDTTDARFETMDEQMFKETVVCDISNDVHDIVKQTVQLQIPGVNIDGNLLNFIIMKAIRKYELFLTPVTDKSPQVVNLWENIMALDKSGLLNRSAFLEPQHGNRQEMANTKFKNINDIEDRCELFYQPKAIDILEDNISVWMNEQPSDIYEVKDKPTRTQLMRELATNVQQKLTQKQSEDKIKEELVHWLNKIVKPQMRRNVSGLAENLKDKIIKLPQDETLNKAHEKRMNTDKDISKEYNVPVLRSLRINEADEKLNEFIEQFIHHTFKIDDDVVKDVLKLMVKQDLYKLSPAAREDLYNNSDYDALNTNKFQTELKIIEEVYDWLKEIPFYFPLLQPGNETIEFVHGLARYIANIETERINYPHIMDYDSWLHTEIAVYLLKKEKALIDEDKFKIDYYANLLCSRIEKLRKDYKENNLNKLITEHMKKYESQLGKDYLKKILWHRRINEDVMKVLIENPSASEADVKKALQQIRIPRDQSVLKFKTEMKYNIIIHDWLQGFPLIPPTDNAEELTRKTKVQELLQKIMEIDERKIENPRDPKADEDLDNYIANWISELNHDPTEDFDVMMKIKELRCGLDYIKLTEPQLSLHINEQRSTNKSKRHSKPNDPGEQLVEAIESWCNNLPIEEDNNDATKARKEHVATNIFQLLGTLSYDPRITKKFQNFIELLGDGIDEQLRNLSDHDAVVENKDNLKAELLDKIIEIKNVIRDITAGDDYVQALENSIDTSLPISTHRSTNKSNPGYELFKKRMVMLWLLENYDYAVDFQALKYKKMLSMEIDLLTEEAQKENIFPADKDEMMNDIISVFYNAQPPNEESIIYEIEYIKMRCEIEAWVKELPLREALDFKKLLERDQILTILTKTLFDIERSEESDADEKMREQIMNWTKKLPLLPGEKNNLKKYANLLICLLKSSASSRKCQRKAEPNNLTVAQETLRNLKEGDELNRIKETLNAPKKRSQEYTSHLAGPSVPKPCNQDCGVSKDKLVYLISTAIHDWCILLPLEYEGCDGPNVVQTTKEHIFQRLMQYVSELHYRPDTLNNEGLYDHFLNNEIERILIQLTKDRLYWEEQHCRNNRKRQFINALKAIRPLVLNEKDREAYKEELKHTISSFHESLLPYADVQLNENTQSAILDDFMQYINHKGNFESQELYKLKISDAINDELKEQEMVVDPLLAANRLICEMSKVKPPIPTQRRYSQPNPIGGVNRLSSVHVQRRQSLPQHLLQKTCAFPYQDYSSYPQNSSLKMYPDPVPAPRVIYQTPPNIPQEPIPFAAARTIGPRSPDLQHASMPFLGSRTHGESASNLQLFPLPLPRSRLPFANLELRPFPPPPAFNDSTYHSRDQPIAQTSNMEPEIQPRYIEQRNVQPDFDDAGQSYREYEAAQNIEQQNCYLNVPLEGDRDALSRSTARAQEPRSLIECPEELRRINRVRERWQDKERRGRRVSETDYCETCDRHLDCIYSMPRPYPLPDCMYN